MLPLLMNIARVCIDDRPITLVNDRKMHPACYTAPTPGYVDYVNERRRDYISLLKKGCSTSAQRNAEAEAKNAKAILEQKESRP